MTHSLVAKLSELKHKGFITDTEYNQLKKALNSLRIDEMYQLEMENAEEFIPKSVLDKIRAKIEEYNSTIDNAISEDELKIEGMKEAYADCLEIIDKYRAESER